MNLTFKIIYAAHANGTHHKLALDALRHLKCERAEQWRAVFLKNAEQYLIGSKLPDKEFKDFRNHVLHVRDDYWGGAPEKAESWYNLFVRALREEKFEEAVWSAGILSHYYTDPIHPFHTAQSEAESNIHRAVEWSISKSYEDLRKRGLRQPITAIDIGYRGPWVKDMVIAGAEHSNTDYEALIAHYNFDVGVVDPPAGLDEVAKDLVGRLLVYASFGFAAILDRAISEANVAPPEVSLTADAVLAGLKIPVKWVTRKLADAEDARQVQRMYDELQQTGTVSENLPEDDRVIRDLHASEVLSGRRGALQQGRKKRRGASPLPHGDMPRVATNSKPTVASPQTASVSVPPVAAESNPEPQTLEQEPPPISEVALPVEPELAENDERDSRFYLDIDDDLEAAPSIGPKTASRLEAIGLYKVRDLLDSDPETVAELVGVRHITRQAVIDWQDQARLVMNVSRLRGTHAQLLVGSGFRTVEAVASADPSDLTSAILQFAQTRDGQRILRDGNSPQIEKVNEWVQAAAEQKQAA
ncbi:MAG: DUF4332 domain-containing protein [Pseudomonadota bacterium]